MPNPSALTDKMAVLEADSTEDSVSLDPAREYTLFHDGLDTSESEVTDTIYLSTSAAVDADGSAGEDKGRLKDGRAVVVGPNVSTLKFKTASGSPTMTVVPSQPISPALR